MIDWLLDDHPIVGFMLAALLILGVIAGFALLLVHLLGGHTGCPPGQMETFRYFITVKTVLVPVYTCGAS